MYLITYQKRNGDVFCRIRNTMPDCGIGNESSMGWKVLDIKYRFKDNFYTLPKCNELHRKQYKKNHAIRKLKKLLSTYASTLLLLIMILFYLIK